MIGTMTKAPPALIKLNLGCRKTRIPGFLNVDIRAEQDVDIVANACDLRGKVQSGTCAEVYASNILEHFPMTHTVEVLREWCRVLAPGGKLWLSVPDWDAVYEIYGKTGMMTDWLTYHLYGEQGYEQQFHYIIFTWQNMRYILDQAGFRGARRIVSLPYGLADASTIRYEATGTPVALNVEAYK